MQKPRLSLNVHSDFLVYLWNVPVGMRGREMKQNISKQIGPVRFIETFEAWNYRPTGHVIVEFESLASVEFFTEMMEAERVPYLPKPVGCQDLITFGRRQFFELVYRDTSVDLLGCSGNPPSSDWNRQRPRGMAVRSALGTGSSGGGYGSGAQRRNVRPYDREGGGRAIGRRQRSESPSPTDAGPFPRASTVYNGDGGALRRFLWSTEKGRTHILTVDELGVAHGAGAAAAQQRQMQKFARGKREMEIEEGEIVEDNDEHLLRAESNSDEGVEEGQIEIEEGEIVVPDDDDSYDVHEVDPAFSLGDEPPHILSERNRYDDDCGGINRWDEVDRTFRPPPQMVAPLPPSLCATTICSSANRNSSNGNISSATSFARELQQRLHSLFGAPPPLTSPPPPLQQSPLVAVASRQQQPHLERHQQYQQRFPSPPLAMLHQQQQQTNGVGIKRKRQRRRFGSGGGAGGDVHYPPPSHIPPPHQRQHYRKNNSHNGNNNRNATAAMHQQKDGSNTTRTDSSSGGGTNGYCGAIKCERWPRRRDSNGGNNGVQHEHQVITLDDTDDSDNDDASGMHHRRRVRSTVVRAALVGSSSTSRRSSAATPPLSTNNTNSFCSTTSWSSSTIITMGGDCRPTDDTSTLCRGLMSVTLPPSSSIDKPCDDDDDDAAVEVECTDECQQTAPSLKEENAEEELDYWDWDEFELVEHDSFVERRQQQDGDDHAAAVTSKPVTEPEAMDKGSVAGCIDQETGPEEANAEEREISRLLDEDGDDTIGHQQQQSFDESILDDNDCSAGDGGSSDSTGIVVAGGVPGQLLRNGMEAEEEEMDDCDTSNDDGLLNLSIRRMSQMSLLNTEEEDDNELPTNEYRVLEIQNLCPGYSLDAIREQLQRAVGDVPCAVHVSPTHARFHCDCGAERAARFLCQQLDAAQRVQLLGPAPEFSASAE